MPVPVPETGEPQSDAERVAWLIPLLGEENVRRMLETPVTEAQRKRVADIVRRAPRRVG